MYLPPHATRLTTAKGGRSHARRDLSPDATLAERVARVRMELGLNDEKPLAAAVKEANEAAGLEPRGSVASQVRTLLVQLDLVPVEAALPSRAPSLSLALPPRSSQDARADGAMFSNVLSPDRQSLTDAPERTDLQGSVQGIIRTLLSCIPTDLPTRVHEHVRLLLKNTRVHEATHLLDGLRNEGVITYIVHCGPSQHNMMRVTCNQLLSALKCNVEGRETEAALATMFSCFHDMKTAGPWPDTITYNIMIGASFRACKLAVCFGLFEEMRCAGLLPTARTFSTIMNAFASAGQLHESLYFLDLMLHYQIDMNGTAGSIALTVLTKLGDLPSLVKECSYGGFTAAYQWLVQVQGDPHASMSLSASAQLACPIPLGQRVQQSGQRVQRSSPRKHGLSQHEHSSSNTKCEPKGAKGQGECVICMEK